MASTAYRLSSQDRKDLEKFTKYLVYKCMQVIVQSRLGMKMQTISSPFSSSADWFNLDINDIPEVLNETKKVFANLVGGCLNVGQNICLEISLHTVEGERMVLETWWMTLTDTVDPSARVSYTVYNRMGTLMKALLCASRVVPAYKLSRKQGSDTFVICYRIYTGDPQFHLGADYQKKRIGTVPTPTGTVILSVAYRTKMLMSPQNSLHRDLPFEVKDDHFMEGSPRRKPHDVAYPCHLLHKERPRRQSFGDDGMIFAADPPDCDQDYVDACFCPHEAPSDQNYSPPYLRQNSAAINEDLSSKVRMGAFAPHANGHLAYADDTEDVPFMNLLMHGDKLNANDQRNMRREESGLSKSAGSTSNKSCCSNTEAPNEDYVMVQLKTPFAGNDANSELNGFYRDCQGAPQLSMMKERCSVQETLNCITQQLAEFETNAKDFDEFINSIKVSADA